MGEKMKSVHDPQNLGREKVKKMTEIIKKCSAKCFLIFGKEGVTMSFGKESSKLIKASTRS